MKEATKADLPVYRKIPKARIALEGFSDDAVERAIKAIQNDRPLTSGYLRTAEFKQFIAAKPEVAGDLPAVDDKFFARKAKVKDGQPPESRASSWRRSFAKSWHRSASRVSNR